MKLVEVLARALSSETLDELAASVATIDRTELATSATDVLFCWWVRGLAVPDAIIARARAALVEAPISHRVAFALIVGEPTEIPLPPDGGWEELATWAVGASPMALPGLDRGMLAGCEEDLLRGVGLALFLRNASIAARLLRWLALSLPADMLHEAMDDTMRIARKPSDGFIATRIARAVQHRANVPVASARAELRTRTQPRFAVLAEDRRHVFLDRAIGWIEQHLDRFTIGANEVDTKVVPRFKAAGELALVANHLIDAGEREGQERWRTGGLALRDFALSQIGDAERLADIVERTPHMAAFATILPPLYRAGLRNERLDAAIARHAGSLAPDLAYFVGVSMRDIGLASPWDLETAWGWTRIVNEPAPWRLSTAELYLMLHEVWYRAADGWPDDRGRAYITRWLPVWIRYTEMAGHHDLLAELVITWHVLHRTPAPGQAWDVLLAAQRDDGAIPTTRPNVNAGTAVMTDEYHATLNGIWAAATYPTP